MYDWSDGFMAYEDNVIVFFYREERERERRERAIVFFYKKKRERER